MRRSLLAVAVISTFAILSGCAKDVGPTGPTGSSLTPGARSEVETFDPNTFSSIVSGSGFSCAKRNSGTVYCWGQNDQFQIGRGSGTCRSGTPCIAQPTIVLKNGGIGSDPIVALDLGAGTGHVCTRDTAGAAWCWGDGRNGQVGFAFGQTGPSVAVPVVGGIKFTSVNAGGTSSCGTTTNGVFCWGSLGSPTTGGSPQPMQLSTGRRHSFVVMGALHGCATSFNKLTGAAAVDCWGRNINGQLGLPPSSPFVPFAQASSLGTSVVGISAADAVTCVEQSNGTVQCVGNNLNGQLGNSLFIQTGAPQTIPIAGPLHGVSVGGFHSCAIDAADVAWCWGAGTSGQLGNGNFVSSTRPQPVLGLTFRAIAAGVNHTCAIGTDNGLYCWGSNANGQLGIADKNGGGSATPMRARDPGM